MVHRNISVVVIESCSWTTRYKVFVPVFANRVTRPLRVLQCARPRLANHSRARGCPNRSFAGAEWRWIFNPPCPGPCSHLRRRPLACSIGFQTGSVRMPTTSPSCTCVAELLTDTGKLPSTGVDVAPALVFNCIVWWPSSGTRRLRGKSHVIASFDHPHHSWGDRRLARWHHRQRGRFWPRRQYHRRHSGCTHRHLGTRCVGGRDRRKFCS